MHFYKVPMSPDGRIRWRAAILPELDATLYLPDTHSKSMQLAKVLMSGHKEELLAEGDSGGKVYESPLNPNRMVIKEFTSDYGNGMEPEYGGLPTLRASVLLGKGLEKIRQRGPWRLRGVRVLGALIMNNHIPEEDLDVVPSDEPDIYSRWTMERLDSPADSINTHVDNIDSFPPEEERIALYNKALTTILGPNSPHIPEYDDGYPNLIVTRMPKQGIIPRPGIAYKIDTSVESGFDY